MILSSAHMSLRSILGLSHDQENMRDSDDQSQTPAFTLQLQIYIVEKHHLEYVLTNAVYLRKDVNSNFLTE